MPKPHGLSHQFVTNTSAGFWTVCLPIAVRVALVPQFGHRWRENIMKKKKLSNLELGSKIYMVILIQQITLRWRSFYCSCNTCVVCPEALASPADPKVLRVRVALQAWQ